MDAIKEETTQKLKELYASIPESLQKAIMSSNYQMKLVEIGRVNNLTVDQLGKLELATTFVMLGATSPNNYQSELEKNLGLANKESIGKIVDAVNTQIFEEIREDLKSINALPEGEPEDDDNETFWKQDVLNEKVSPKEEATLVKSGIELEKTRPSSEENLLQTTLPTSTLQSRANILDGIENPTASKSSFVSKQLSGTFSMPTKETTYTPKPAASPVPPPAGKPAAPAANVPPASEAPKTDPYREAF